MTPFHRFEHTLEILEEASISSLEVAPFTCLEWEVGGDDLWLRPALGDVEVVWCYLGQGKLRERLQQPSRHKTAAKKVGKALNAKRFWRFWPLVGTEGGLFLRRDFGLIRLPGKPFLARFDFRGEFKNADDVLECEPRRLEQIVRRLEEQDEFQETLRWLRDYEGEWSNVYFERGSRVQLEALLKAFWALFRPPGHQFEEWIYTSSPNNSQVMAWYWAHAGFSRSEDGPAKTRRLFELLHEAIVTKNVIQQPYDASGQPERMEFPRIVAPLPSAHERMEALMVWREFLCDKLSPEEIEALLPKF